MFTFLKSRAFLRLLGLLLLALFVWFAGPYFAFGPYQPLASPFARWVCIGLLAALWLASSMAAWWRARRASAQLAGAVLQQREPERPSADVAKLRERFEEAVGSLTGGTTSASSLYELPWYAFIGAPGSGKTTTLVNSGLRFPLEQRVGKAAVRGVGGTRNCDWWFTEEAVFLDTAGRYTTQDSDAGSDSEGWREFLALLAKYRKRRPLNGLVLTISAQDLMTQGEAGLETHVDAVHRRLQEFVRELQIQLPVYVMVTKCDTIAGFTDFFDDLSAEGRAQVWGVTFPYDQSVSGGAAAMFPREFDALLERLSGRLFGRVEETRGGRRRGGVFAFPQQMAALREPLVQFLGDVFGTRQLEGQVLLRGVYFTSGTQDGTQIDRLMGAIGRRFGVAPEVTAPAAGRGKAYFVERLLREVVIAESGLAGVNRQLERRNALWQFGAYAAIAVVVVAGVALMSASYARNRAYLDQVGADVASLQRLPPVGPGARVETLLPRLNAVAAVADSAERFRDGVPILMRWGLYQGSSLGNAARDAYVRELDGRLLPEFADRIQRRVREHAADPERLYLFLKGYLMLGQPQHLDKDHLLLLAENEWPVTGGAAPSVATHLRRLLEDRDGLRPIALDASLVAQAQATITRASVAQIMYGWVQRDGMKDEGKGLRFDLEAGVGIEKVLDRKSGRRVADPFPRLYTKAAFREVTTIGMKPLVDQFAAESWVWGASRSLSVPQIGALTEQVIELYERDYARAWTETLQDLRIRPFASVSEYAEALTLLVGPTSPLRGVLKVVTEHTALVEAQPAAPAEAPSLGSRITQGARDLLKSTAQKVTGLSGVTPGTRVTTQFQPIHKVMAGAPAPIDAVFEQVRKIRDQLAKIGPQVGGSDPVRSLSDPALLDLWHGLTRDAATLPPPLNEWFTQIAQYTGDRVSDAATDTLDQRYRTFVVPECRARLNGRYPFGPPSQGDMSLTDFGDLFGAGGLYDKFFTDHLASLVDTTQRPWAWRPGSVRSSTALLAQFEEADRIKRMFFGAGGKAPKLSFTIVASDLDASANGFYLSLDGQALRISKPTDRAVRAVEWPGPQGATGLRATFEDRVAAAVDAHNVGTPWALFRVIDAAGGVADGDRDTVMTVRSPHHQATVRVTASNPAANPFGRREWRQFSCES